MQLHIIFQTVLQLCTYITAQGRRGLVDGLIGSDRQRLSISAGEEMNSECDKHGMYASLARAYWDPYYTYIQQYSVRHYYATSGKT